MRDPEDYSTAARYPAGGHKGYALPLSRNYRRGHVGAFDD